MRDKLQWMLVIVVSMALGAAAVVGIDSLRSEPAPQTAISAPTSSTSTSGSTVSQSTDTGVSDVADLYAKVRPSVVRITGQNTRSGASGLGSGIVIDDKGHILTNNHVVSGFDQIDVTLADGTSVSAEVVNTDPGNDIALVKVDLPASKLSPATLGDSSKVRPGELVIAVGNPFGIEGSITEGIISGVGRTLASGPGRPLRQLIQADAAINPGNSGGAMFNARGEVIGIPTALENPSGENVFVGIGYAVPINTAKRFLPDLLAKRTIEHPRMGIGLQNVTPALAKRLGISVEQGALVTQVDTNSAAGRAGMKGGTGVRNSTIGDVIVSIDGKEVKTSEDLVDYIDNKKVGDKVQVKIVRDNKEMTLDVTLDAWKVNTSA